MRRHILVFLFSVLATASASPAQRLEPTAGRLLVADRSLLDPNFKRTVVLMLAYDENGALGLIVNRPTEVELSHALPDLDGRSGAGKTVWFGGPVSTTSMRMLFGSDESFEESESVLEGVQVSGSRKLLERIAGRRGKRAVPFKVLAGYAGWGPGQLDHEIERGDWHVIEGDPELVFTDEPNRTWQRLAPGAPGLRAGPPVKESTPPA